MDGSIPLLLVDVVESGSLWALLLKGSMLCLLGVSMGAEFSVMPAVVRHRIALGAVTSLAALPVLAMTLNSWELPILPREAESGDNNSSLLMTVLAGIYLGVAVILLARLCLDVMRIALLSSRAKFVSTADTLLPDLDHPRGDTPIGYSGEIRSPLTWGWLSPQILLPQDATRWKTEDLSMVLRHELAHVARGDWATHVMSRCVQSLYWPIPGMRLLLRQLSLSAEQACDDQVLATGVAAPQYAAMLLRRAQGSRIPASVSLGHNTELGTRIRYLVVEIVDHSPFATGAVATFFTCFALTLAVATAQLGQRPEIPVLEWGSGEPDKLLGTSTYQRPSLDVSPAILAALVSGTARPQPPPQPLKPPKFEPLDRPPIPPP